MNTNLDPVLLLAGLAAGFALLSLLLVLRQAGAFGRLQAMAEAALHSGADSAERLAETRGAMAAGIETIRHSLAHEHLETRLMMEERLNAIRALTGDRLAEIERRVNEQLHEAVEKQMTASFARVVEQFAAVQKAVGDVQAITADIGDIKRLFGNVKTRGGWGETQVKLILDDILPPGSYETNVQLSQDSSEAVEFAVRLPMRGDRPPLLAIDAKFPVEDYQRLLAASAAGDAEAERLACAGLERRIRLEAAKIADKYIRPPVTVEFAVLYLPTDALFAEVARIPGLIDEIRQKSRVMLLGPSLLPALLRTIQLGFITLSLEQKAGQIVDLLGATRAEMVKMDDVLERLGKQAATFGSTIDKARTRTRAVSRKLQGLTVMDPAIAGRLLNLDADADDDGEEA